MNKTWKHLFESVLLPAVAGNVLWTFFTMILDGPSWAELPRLALLLIIGFYLVLAWLLYRLVKITETSGRYWSFEAAYLLTLTVAALSAQYAPNCLRIIVSIYFAIIILGHFADVWSEADETEDYRWRLIFLNGLGLGVLLVGWALGNHGFVTAAELSIPLSFALTLLFWIWWLGRLPIRKIEATFDKPA